ncbi:MAG: hypothetical protein O9294_17935 [Cytophagales bacterium]|nr:hypothetical protein [Cytophagales bacterium]
MKYSVGVDSVWFLRQEQPNENLEEVLFIQFEKGRLCINLYLYNNYSKEIISKDLESCIRNQENNQLLLYELNKYCHKITVNSVKQSEGKRMLFVTKRINKEYDTVLEDYLFVEQVIKISAFDNATGVQYIPTTRSRRKRNKI